MALGIFKVARHNASRSEHKTLLQNQPAEQHDTERCEDRHNSPHDGTIGFPPSQCPKRDRDNGWIKARRSREIEPYGARVASGLHTQLLRALLDLGRSAGRKRYGRRRESQWKWLVIAKLKPYAAQSYGTAMVR